MPRQHHLHPIPSQQLALTIERVEAPMVALTVIDARDAAHPEAMAGKPAKVAAVQMVSGPSIDSNLQRIESLVGQAVDAQASLVVLPEMLLCIGPREQVQQSWQSDQGHAAVDRLCELAQRHRCWILAGSVPWQALPDDPLPYARSLLIDSSGRIVAHYDKLHLFDASVDDATGQYRESEHYRPGDRAVLVDTPFGRLGLSICYDLRFPELFRLYFEAGVDLLAVPSAFTAVTGAAHWHALLRSRAIENGCYVIAANQGGEHSPKRHSFGHSLVIDPWGSVLAEHAAGEGLAIADLDLSRCQQVRRELPCQQHQRIRYTTPQS